MRARATLTVTGSLAGGAVHDDPSNNTVDASGGDLSSVTQQLRAAQRAREAVAKAEMPQPTAWPPHATELVVLRKQYTSLKQSHQQQQREVRLIAHMAADQAADDWRRPSDVARAFFLLRTTARLAA